MGKIIKKEITATVFATEDGQEFVSKKDAEIHDKKINGLIKVCRECGNRPEEVSNCSYCEGNGHFTLVKAWVPYKMGAAIYESEPIETDYTKKREEK